MYYYKHNKLDVATPFIFGADICQISFKQKSLARKTQCKHDVLIWCFPCSSTAISFQQNIGCLLRHQVYFQRVQVSCLLSVRASSASSASAIWEKEIAVEGMDVFPSNKYVRVH